VDGGSRFGKKDEVHVTARSFQSPSAGVDGVCRLNHQGSGHDKKPSSRGPVPPAENSADLGFLLRGCSFQDQRQSRTGEYRPYGEHLLQGIIGSLPCSGAFRLTVTRCRLDRDGQRTGARGGMPSQSRLTRPGRSSAWHRCFYTPKTPAIRYEEGTSPPPLLPVPSASQERPGYCPRGSCAAVDRVESGIGGTSRRAPQCETSTMRRARALCPAMGICRRSRLPAQQLVGSAQGASFRDRQSRTLLRGSVTRRSCQVT